MDSTYLTLRNAVEELETFPEGVAMSDILLLPSPLRQMMRRLMRKRRLTLDELAALLDLKREQAQEIGQALVEKGCLQQADGEHRYRFHMARSNRTQLSDSVWQALDDL